MKNTTFSALALWAAGTLAAQATTVTFDQALLTTDTTVESDGLTLTASTPDGRVDTFAGGPFQGGLYIGAIAPGTSVFTANTTAPAFGTYNLSFDKAITSIEISFGFLSNVFSPAETISNFATDGNAVSITYANVSNTSFDPSLGGTVSTSSPQGRGIISFSGSAFQTFSFFHAQNPQNIGFTIGNIEVELAPVPLPATAWLLLAGLGALFVGRRRMRT